MENVKLKELLDKYSEAETSIEEEKSIRKLLFESTDPEFSTYKQLFAFYEDEKRIKYNAELILPKPKVVKGNFIRRIAVAASIIILLSITATYYFVNNKAKVNDSYMAGEVKDPEEALKITMEALAILSKNYDKAGEALADPIENLEKLDIIKSN